MKNGISVVVCCYNSADRLPQTIKHLALQIVPDKVLWEIIIVDNASTDNTKYVAHAEWANYNLPSVSFKITGENISGLSNARAKGVYTSKYEYIVFCDDDNWLHRDYLAVAYSIMSSNDKIGALGGQSDFISDIDLIPNWFEGEKGAYAVGKQSEFSGNVTERGFLWGSALVLKKENYLKAFKNFPSILSDRKGKELSSGGDSEICMRLIYLGLELYYDERLKFTHSITKERLTVQYLDKLHLGFADSKKSFNKYNKAITIFSLKKKEQQIQILKSFFKFFLSKISLTKKWDFRHEGLQLYLHSGIKVCEIDQDFLLIRNWLVFNAKESPK